MRYVLILALLCAGCASYADLGNGRVAKVELSEERSPFGTNAGWSRLMDCERVVKNNQPPVYVDCRPLSAWVPISSQGQGGQIVSGALTGLGFGLGGAFSGAGGSSSASSSAVWSGGKGH